MKYPHRPIVVEYIIGNARRLLKIHKHYLHYSKWTKRLAMQSPKIGSRHNDNPDNYKVVDQKSGRSKCEFSI